jgi:hypothetical protein
LIGGEIVSNTASMDGGGLFIEDSDAKVEMDGVLIAHNTAPLGDGGGLYVSSAYVTVTNALIRSNSAGVLGGGVVVADGSAALEGVSIVDNTGGYGGGVIVESGTFTATNTTLSGNQAITEGGGIYIQNGTLTLVYVTVANNTALGAGGGIHNVAGTVALQDTLVAYGSPDNCSGALTSSGHNMEDGTGCGLASTGDITGTDPLLGSLVSDGGAWVRPLSPVSPAVDKGACLPLLTTVDQRGATRPQGDWCDIGAYELIRSDIYLPLVLKN